MGPLRSIPRFNTASDNTTETDSGEKDYKDKNALGICCKDLE